MSERQPAELLKNGDDSVADNNGPLPSTRRRDVLKAVGSLSLLSTVGVSPALGSESVPAAIGGTDLNGGRALPRLPEPANTLDTLDMREVSGAQEGTAEYYQKELLAYSLQGVINRTQPRIYLPRDSDAGDSLLWTEELENEWDYTLNYHTSVWDLFDQYASELDGVIVYDPSVPHTINAAVTLAGHNKAPVAHPDLLDTLQNDHGLSIVKDLRDDNFADKYAVYDWMINNLWDNTTDDLLQSQKPVAETKDPLHADDPASEYDYYVEVARNETKDTDLSPITVSLTDPVTVENNTVYVRIDDSNTSDGWGAALEKTQTVKDGEGNVVYEFDPATDAHLYDDNSSGIDPHNPSRWADGDDYWVLEFEVPDDVSELTAELNLQREYIVCVSGTRPPNGEGLNGDKPKADFKDYGIAANAMTMWSDPNDSGIKDRFGQVLDKMPPNSPVVGWTSDEVRGVIQMSKKGTWLVPSQSSAAFWAGKRPDINDKTKGYLHDETSGPANDPSQEPSKSVEDKVYVTVTLSEGDNLQYVQSAMKSNWDDNNRGTYPINWNINPVLEDIGPMLMEYYYRTATENDYFVGPSTLGYFYPMDYPKAEMPTLLGETAEIFDDYGLETLYMLNRLGIDSWLSAESANIFQETIDPIGIQNGWDHNTKDKPRIKHVGDDTINAHGIVGLKERDVSPDKVVEIIRDATPSDWDDNPRPVFLSVGLFGFSNDPTTVVNALDQLDQDKYEIVHADDFFSLARTDEGPNDLDGDGLYEDVDGDGDEDGDIDDVRALFDKSDSDRVTDNPGDFDFDGDGSFSLRDVVALFRDIYN